MSKKQRRTPRITTQPRIPHWEYHYKDRGDYALITTYNRRGAPYKTERCILKQHVPQWIRNAMPVIELAYDQTTGYAEVPGFGRMDADKTTFAFYAQTENT